MSKIGIDARMLGSGFGLARYVQQLVLHLQKIDTQNQYVLFLRKENWDEVKITNQNFKKVLADIPWYSWQEQILFTKIIKKEKVDLMHFPHWNVPVFYSAPFVLTIHDLIMFHFPRPDATTLGPIKFFIKDLAHRFVIKTAMKKAKQIFVTSEFTKQDINHALHVPTEKMIVTYQAPFIDVKCETQTEENLFNKYKIKKPYVLYVGSAYPHKNLKGLLKAWKIFEDKYEEDVQLVLVGKESYFYNQLIESDEYGDLNKKPILTGLVNDQELCSLYKNASLYVFPSLFEGFGLPPLEAMSYGLPVVSSNRTSLPEVLGEAALYFDPENFEQMADVMRTGLFDDGMRFEMKQKSRQELQRYSWDKLSQQTLAIYSKNLK